MNISKESNNFSIELQYGDHELTLSAIGYADSTISYYVHGDSNIEISLDANNDIGRVYGEFQDLFKFQQNISENNDIANWTEKQVFDSVTGATILEDNSTTNFEQAQLFIGDSLFGYADVYGQYWIKIQCGTYPLTGSSEEFSNETKIVKVLPNTKVYMNFFLNHE